VAYSIRLVLFVTVPSMVALMIFRVPIVQLLFERGAFDRTITLVTADVVFFYALGLGAYVSNRVLVAAFYSVQDTTTPVKSGALAVLVNIACSLLLMGPLGVAGLALATAFSSFVNLGLLLAALRRRLGRLGEVPLLPSLLRLGGASVVMGLTGLALIHTQDPVTVAPAVRRAMVLLVELTGCLAAFLVAAACLRSEELNSVLEKVVSRRRRLEDPTSEEDSEKNFG